MFLFKKSQLTQSQTSPMYKNQNDNLCMFLELRCEILIANLNNLEEIHT